MYDMVLIYLGGMAASACHLALYFGREGLPRGWREWGDCVIAVVLWPTLPVIGLREWWRQ
jgi:hypothetical protein